MTSNTTRIDISYDDSTGGDPRAAMTRATQAARAVVAELTETDTSSSTPCSEWNALDVARHIVAVVDRATAGATGRSLDDMPQLAAVDHADLNDALAASTRALQAAWADDATLSATVDVPWGTFPGAAVLAVYTADLLVHTWDLAVAIGVELNRSEGDVNASLEMAKIGFPDDAREGMPFEPVIRSEPDAAAIEHLAGWVGRDVSRWRCSRGDPNS